MNNFSPAICLTVYSKIYNPLSLLSLIFQCNIAWTGTSQVPLEYRKIYHSECSGLPGAATNNHATTSTKFPVSHGTQVILACKTGHEKLSGDETITCNGGEEFLHSSNGMLQCAPKPG